MRIDAYNQIQQIYGTQKLTKTEKKAAGASFQDQLMLSATAQDASIAKKAVAATPDVRQNLVNSIKERIDNDTYEVDMEDFAGKLLERYNGLF
ncbi:MAG: flagellar biosynthesis anti-sigma factor FlgM [Lachnospiraceae bacterium]|nr:flagellar biosynthesis anti-sigma factor FlgM [Lachnospiraceae bacterium]MDE7274592.1 flagellar biosynthesis anti-sigma factor FlgM [Lachnospiraceae bacterium]